MVSSNLPLYIKADQVARSIKDRKGALVSAQDEANLRTFVACTAVYWNEGVTYSSQLYY